MCKKQVHTYAWLCMYVCVYVCLRVYVCCVLCVCVCVCVFVCSLCVGPCELLLLCSLAIDMLAAVRGVWSVEDVCLCACVNCLCLQALLLFVECGQRVFSWNC